MSYIALFNVIHCSIGMKCFLFIYQNACLLLLSYIYISFIFYKVVKRCIYVVVGYIIITLLQTVRRVKNFENRSIVGEDMGKSKVPRFLWTTLYMQCI